MLHRLLPVLLFLITGFIGGCSQSGRQAAFYTGGKNNGQQAVAILSLDNTTVSAARSLNTAFARTAPRYGLVLPKGHKAKADFYLKGYFSVLIEESPGENVILYVFDILSQSGLRLHRIQGKYPLPSSYTKAPEHFWDMVSPDGYQAIANNILYQLNKWRARLNAKKTICKQLSTCNLMVTR